MRVIADPAFEWTLMVAGLVRPARNGADQVRQDGAGDLHEAIDGYLRTIDRPAGAFHSVYCAFVLKNVEG